MKRKIAERLFTKYVLPSFSGWHVKLDHMFAKRICHLYLGFGIESSAYTAADFYLRVQVVPLYTKEEGLGGGVSTRIGNTRNWQLIEAKEEKVGQEMLQVFKTEGIAYLEKLGSLDRYAARSRIFGNEKDSRLLEEIAGAYVLLGRYKEAADTLYEAIERSLDARQEAQELTNQFKIEFDWSKAEHDRLLYL